MSIKQDEESNNDSFFENIEDKIESILNKRKLEEPTELKEETKDANNPINMSLCQILPNEQVQPI